MRLDQSLRDSIATQSGLNDLSNSGLHGQREGLQTGNILKSMDNHQKQVHNTNVPIQRNKQRNFQIKSINQPQINHLDQSGVGKPVFTTSALANALSQQQKQFKNEQLQSNEIKSIQQINGQNIFKKQQDHGTGQLAMQLQGQQQKPSIISSETQAQTNLSQLLLQKQIMNAIDPNNQANQQDNEMIVIHVFDENRNISKDFKCNKQLIKSNMRYFEKHLNDKSQPQDIDISVHCDVKIFEWLIKYINQKNFMKINNIKLGTNGFIATHIQFKKELLNQNSQLNQINPNQINIDLKNVISILISCEFLDMQDLVEECISYVVSNLHDVVRLPIDMSCLNDNLLSQISAKVPMTILNDLMDKRDKLKSRIFEKKLSLLLKLLEIEGTYNFKVHEFIWQNKIYEQLQKDKNEGQGDTNVYKANLQTQYIYKDDKLCLFDSESGQSTSIPYYREKRQVIMCCTYCQQFFIPVSDQSNSKSIRQFCPKSKTYIDFWGQEISEHLPDKNFELSGLADYMSRLTTQITKQELFWKIWSTTQYFTCVECNYQFSGADIHRCTYHQDKPLYEKIAKKHEDESGVHITESIQGKIPCCSQSCQRFGMVLNLNKGCKQKQHIAKIDENDPLQMQKQMLEILTNVSQKFGIHKIEEQAGDVLIKPISYYLNKFLIEKKKNARKKNKKRDLSKKQSRPIQSRQQGKESANESSQQRNQNNQSQAKTSQEPRASKIKEEDQQAIAQINLSILPKSKRKPPQIPMRSQNDASSLSKRPKIVPNGRRQSRRIETENEKGINKQKIKMPHKRPPRANKPDQEIVIEDASDNSDHGNNKESANNQSYESAQSESSDEGVSDAQSAEVISNRQIENNTVESQSSTSSDFASVSESSDDDLQPLPSDRGTSLSHHIGIMDQIHNLVDTKDQNSVSNEQKPQHDSGDEFKRAVTEEKVDIKDLQEEKNHFANFEQAKADLRRICTQQQIDKQIRQNQEKIERETPKIYPCTLDQPRYVIDQNSFFQIKRRERKFNMLYHKKPQGPLPIEPVTPGLGFSKDQLFGEDYERQEPKIPHHLQDRQIICFMGNQITAPFSRTNRAEQRKYKYWRGEYLTTADEVEMKNLTQQLLLQRQVELVHQPRKKKRAKRDTSTVQNTNQQSSKQNNSSQQKYQPILSNNQPNNEEKQEQKEREKPVIKTDQKQIGSLGNVQGKLGVVGTSKFQSHQQPTPSINQARQQTGPMSSQIGQHVGQGSQYLQINAINNK